MSSVSRFSGPICGLFSPYVTLRKHYGIQGRSLRWIWGCVDNGPFLTALTSNVQAHLRGLQVLKPTVVPNI